MWKHGLSMLDADDVWLGPAKYFPQPADASPRFRREADKRPERVVMIGPDWSGRLLTFILELPDERGVSHVVTGWVSLRANNLATINGEEGCATDERAR